MESRLTVRDRCVFGAIAALAGLLVGAALCVVLLYEHPGQPFNRSLLFFSVAYFYFAGFVLGARAADLLSGAGQVGVRQARHELDRFATPPAEPETVPSDTATVLVAAGYVLGAVALVYFG